MDPKAVKQARQALDEATRHTADMEVAQDFAQLENRWASFLLSADLVYNKLKAGTKSGTKSREWYAAKEDERNGDPLLLYIHQARNSHGHTIEDIAVQTPASLAFKSKGGPWSLSGGVIWATETELNMRGVKHESAPVEIVFTPTGTKLAVITDREKKYEPPTSHLGKDLPDNKPITVAKLALPYLQSMIEEAEKLT